MKNGLLEMVNVFGFSGLKPFKMKSTKLVLVEPFGLPYALNPSCQA